MASTSHGRPLADLDRREGESPAPRVLKKELNLAQTAALSELERFGWHLQFIRNEPPKPPLVVVCDPDAHKYAILDEEGELIENPTFLKFRQSTRE
ncbi:MAG: hypothetical protein M3485_10150 [Pseudomonadota bacterium]|nr:hypothetical protein [Pseudomonadota bacterium]